MPSRGEIKSEKILVKKIFSDMWFRIPEYQRPYVWGNEEIDDLLDDLTFAMTEKAEFEYFLGSFVFQSKRAIGADGQTYDESDLLDGQQRMATISLLFAVLRDLVTTEQAKIVCQQCIYREANQYLLTPERNRLVFATHDEVNHFLDEFVKTADGTTRDQDLANLATRSGDLSVRNLANAIRGIRSFLSENNQVKAGDLLQFLLNKVLLIYVSTENLDDAFRLFTILNDRGTPLRNSDILKSMNLGILTSPAEQVKYAKMWEEAEGELGDEFDRFLNHIRTVLVKDKARSTLLQEFEDKIYDPKEKDKASGLKKPALLAKGRETFVFVERYLNQYRSLLGGENFYETGSFEFDNLVKIMLEALPATDWVPPLLRYFDKFKYNRLPDFLKQLDNKFSADWIGQYSPTDRITSMNQIIHVIDGANAADNVFESTCFDFDSDSVARNLNGTIYGKKFTKYILLKLDYLFNNNHDRPMHIETLSVEHILPQHPEEGSQWLQDFTEEQRGKVTDRLGNLVLITRRKNASQGRLDYVMKKRQYFERCIDTCPNSLRVLNKYEKWTPTELKENQLTSIGRLSEHYGVALTGYSFLDDLPVSTVILQD